MATKLVFYFLYLFFFQILFADEPIFINTLPKSGSVCIVNTLIEGLGRKFSRISHETFPEDGIIEEKLVNFLHSNNLSQGHIDASPRNVALLRNYGVKMILHVRDPRQAVLSWTYHLILCQLHIETYSADAVPPGFYTWTFEQQLNSQLESYYPQVIKWLANWLKVYQKGLLNMKILTYENDFHNQLELYFEKVLNFFNVPLSSFTMYHFPKNMRWNFRKGSLDEWREVLTSEQQRKVTAMMPDEFFSFFSWEK